jgi:hypothetical protein
MARGRFGVFMSAKMQFALRKCKQIGSGSPLRAQKIKKIVFLVKKIIRRNPNG